MIPLTGCERCDVWYRTREVGLQTVLVAAIITSVQAVVLRPVRRRHAASCANALAAAASNGIGSKSVSASCVWRAARSWSLRATRGPGQFSERDRGDERLGRQQLGIRYAWQQDDRRVSRRPRIRPSAVIILASMISSRSSRGLTGRSRANVSIGPAGPRPRASGR